ncbi:MAG: hypothetical protein K9L59_15560 [Desulfobacterales bacterium]|nr:hypothetical protein [Desulfobacterales bacterium]
MRSTSKWSLIFICFLLVATPADAVDYREWIPVLPDSIDGMASAGESRGVNADMNGQSFSSLRQKYGKDGDREILLTIVSGDTAPQIREFRTMTRFRMENEKQLIKSLDIYGNKAVLKLDKNDREGSLYILVEEKTMVVIEAGNAASEKEMRDLAGAVPLDRIADVVR